MFRHILIPTDGSPASARAVKAGVAFAKETGARVTGYCAVEPVYAQIYGEGYMIAGRSIARLEKSVRRVAERHVAGIGKAAKAASVPFQGHVSKADSPYSGIIAAAKQKRCDVIFMASHGRRGLAGLVMGSVTHKVLTHSQIPVLVYR
ncbi:MAG TPA: universal stress protein [Burkholderiales bacterium]|nr:universal stress protein [Burkholderiales bacterium]